MIDTNDGPAPATQKPSDVRLLREQLRRRLDYFAARYLIEPLRSQARRARSRASYIGQAMDSFFLSATNGSVERMNRILDDAARQEYAQTIRRLADLAPEVFIRSVPEANVQQAFVVDAVKRFAAAYARPRILAIGATRDLAVVSLKRLGYPVDTFDLTLNEVDELEVSTRMATLGSGAYDVVFCTSVLEHLADDASFVRRVADVLSNGGVAIFTCDFLEGYGAGGPVVRGNRRFYTKSDLLDRLIAPLTDCELVDVPAWEDGRSDFEAGGYKYAFASLVFRKARDLAFGVAFDNLSLPERARFFEDNGFVVVPSVLSPEQVKTALAEIQSYGLKETTEDLWKVPTALSLVVNGKLLSTLRAIFGDDIRFFKGAYVEKQPDELVPPQQVRRDLHVDHGIGEIWGDYRNSTPSWVNVGIYLTALTSHHAPLWVVPGSHRKMNVVPGTIMKDLEADARMVLAEAGDAVIFHGRTVHAASHNLSSETRHTYFYQYRPAWAKSAGPVPEWPEEFIRSFPPEYHGLFLDLNRGLR